MEQWHEFFLLVGTASPVMMGLLFVALSLRDDIRTGKKGEVNRVFCEHSFQEYMCATLISLYFLIPDTTLATLGLLLMLTSAAPLVIIIRSFLGLRRDQVLTTSHYVWRFSIPSLCYLFCLIAGFLISTSKTEPKGMQVVALVVILLIVIPTRNAYKMLVTGEEKQDTN